MPFLYWHQPWLVTTATLGHRSGPRPSWRVHPHPIQELGTNCWGTWCRSNPRSHRWSSYLYRCLLWMLWSESGVLLYVVHVCLYCGSRIPGWNCRCHPSPPLYSRGKQMKEVLLFWCPCRISVSPNSPNNRPSWWKEVTERNQSSVSLSRVRWLQVLNILSRIYHGYINNCYFI